MAAYSLEVLNDSPEVYWRLGEASGTDAEDSSANVHTGQYAGGPALGEVGIVGADPEPLPDTAVLFDGTSQYFSAAAATWDPYQSATRSLTIELWYKGTDTGSTDDEDSNAVLLRAWGGFSGRWLITLDTGGLVRLFTGSAIGSTVACGVSTTAVNDDDWHHIVVTITASTYATEVWIDGNLEDSDTGVEGAGEPLIAGMISQAGAYTAGLLDELAIYYTVLSSTRIGDHWTAGSSPPPPATEGTGSASFGLSGAAVGSPVEAGTAVGVIGLAAAATGEVEPFPVPFINLAGAAVGAQVGSFLLTTGDEVNPLRGRILTLPELEVLTTLPGAFSDEAREQRNAPGTGKLSLLNDDPAVALITKNMLIQQIVEGQIAFTHIVEDVSSQVVALGEESGEVTTYAGRGHIALLEMGVVYPSRGVGQLPVQRDRVWNWTAAQYDDGFWSASVAAGDADGPLRVPKLQEGRPSVAPSIPGSTWRASTGDTQAFAPGGPVYYRGTVSIPDTREYIILWAADNYGELYIDGQQIDELPRSAGRANYLEGHAVPITISAGNVTFAARVVNVGQAVPVANPNPVGFFFAVVTHDEDGDVDDIIAVADSSWKALGRPAAEPGMTPGTVARLELNEWFDRATAAGQVVPPIVLTCDDELDTAGQPWIETPNIATKVGTDHLTFFTEIAATYWEMRMRPASLQLDLLVKGTVPVSGITYATAPAGEPRLGNIQSLARRTT